VSRKITITLVCAVAVAGIAFVAAREYARAETQTRHGVTTIVAPFQFSHDVPDIRRHGQIELDHGCLVLTESDDTSYLIVWPFGAKLSDDATRVKADGVTYEVGDTFDGGGAVKRLDELGYRDAIPERCANRKVIEVVPD